MYRHTLPKHAQEALAALAAEDATEQQPAEDAKPPGYYATCSAEERRAELHRLRIYSIGHALPSN